MMNHTWSYNGESYPFDISECGCVERITEAIDGLRAGVMRIESMETASPEALLMHCDMIEDFFDTVFGDGYGGRICGEKKSAEDYSAAYIDFIMFVNSEVEAISRLRAEIETAYTCRTDAPFPSEAFSETAEG